MWRQRLGLIVVAVWLVVSLARLTKLVEPAEVPPGQEAAPTFGFFKQHIPATAGYLFVLPGEFGTDTGLGPRLRYELYPRTYDDIRASQDEQAVRDLMRRMNLRYVVVPDATLYPASHWTRQPTDWLKRTNFDADRPTGPALDTYVLEVTS
ncbi:MAG TPA: hypothetical protein VGL99_07055 [Chloroflexota bacterium]|jgi:hypothetical protein